MRTPFIVSSIAMFIVFSLIIWLYYRQGLGDQLSRPLYENDMISSSNDLSLQYSQQPLDSHDILRLLSISMYLLLVVSIGIKLPDNNKIWK